MEGELGATIEKNSSEAVIIMGQRHVWGVTDVPVVLSCAHVIRSAVLKWKIIKKLPYR